jgi:uncharacterized protein (DUF302 family)
VISKADEKGAIVYADIDLAKIAKRRFDLHPNVVTTST